MTIRGRAFIVGAFEHPGQTISGKSTAQVHAKVAFGALVDAGLSAADVDAYLCAGDAPGLGPISMADYLGLKRLRSADSTETGGSSYIAHVGHAAATIAVGKCRVALITLAGHADMTARRPPRPAAPPHLFTADAAVLLGLSASPPPYETGDVRTWRDSLPELDAQVRIPVRYRLGDHDRVWEFRPRRMRAYPRTARFHRTTHRRLRWEIPCRRAAARPSGRGITMMMHGYNHWRGGGRIAGTARWFRGLGLRYGVLLIAGLLAHRPNGFFVFKDGYEYVLVLSVVSLALAVLGPGRFSLDNAAGSEITGWAGGGIALCVAVVATAGMLATFWRPAPKQTPTAETPMASS